MSHRLVTALAVACLLTSTAVAAPQRYTLSQDASKVGFAADLGKTRITGQMPVSRADLTLDFADIRNCKIAVTLDVRQAKANLPFVVEAMKGASVLNAAQYPEMRYQSIRLRRTGDTAQVDGNLTLRGVTRPLRLTAQIYRPKGSPEGDHSNLTVRLTGTLHRSDFGATGFADIVGDDVRIDILARIAAAP